MFSGEAKIRHQTCVTKILTRPKLGLDASLLARSASVVWYWRAVFDCLHVQTRSLQSGDRTLSTTAGAFDANFDISHAHLDGLFRSLLRGTLTGKRSAFSTALEAARSRTGPT